MPLASMSKVTSICGVPRGAGGMPSSLKVPRTLLPRAGHRALALEDDDFDAGLVVAAVEKIWVWRLGMVVLRGIIGVAMPPSVSMASVSGVTSSRSTSFTSPWSTPPWMAAPTATTSSGFTPLCGSLPASLRAVSMTWGMRVMPPTSTSSSILAASSLAAARQSLHRLHRALEEVVAELLQLGAGERLHDVLRAGLVRRDERQVDVVALADELSAILAFSASSLMRWSASGWPLRSMPVSVLNSSTIH